MVAKELDAELQVEGISKTEVKAVLLQALAEENLLKGTMRARGLESDLELQLELKRLELEEAERQRQEAERQREYAEREAERQREETERQRQFELEKEEREFQRQKELMERKVQLSQQESKILKKDQIARSMSLVPRFDEREVEKYFLMFEKFAESMEWPRDMYCLFLQCVLTGKAKDIYCDLSTAQCADYELVKERILQAYELVPETYHQKFRNLVKQDGQTHVEFARENENAFDRWLSTMKVDDYDKLKQLVLVEEFKRRVHLDEQTLTHLKSAAVLADDYALTHKKSGFSHNKSYPVKSYWSSHSGVKHQPKTSNENKGSSPKVANDKPDKSETEQMFHKFKKGPVCFHCKKSGHLMSDCWLLKKERESHRLRKLLWG